MAIYNRLKVYRANAQDAAYSEITDSSTRIVLDPQDDLYTYTDSTGGGDHWYKTSYFHSSTLVESEFSTPVKGQASKPIQLLKNMQVVIEVDESVKDTDGNSIGSDYEFYFTTPYDPLYCTVRQIRMEAGAYLTAVTDDAINLAIFEASLQANFMTLVVAASDNVYYKFVRGMWVCCKALEMLLLNVLGARNGLRSKKLDNLEVTYDVKGGGVDDALERALACLAKWEAALLAGGYGKQTPRYVVKGELDPDAPQVGRMWSSDSPMPMINTKVPSVTGRRWAGAYSRNPSPYARSSTNGHRYYGGNKLKVTIGTFNS
jgi:hypothetical protein